MTEKSAVSRRKVGTEDKEGGGGRGRGRGRGRSGRRPERKRGRWHGKKKEGGAAGSLEAA